MGREWPVVSETVNLRLRPFNDDIWEAEVDFACDEELPFALLGYEGFLNRWVVTFNGPDGYFVVEGPDDVGARERWAGLFP